MQSIADTGIMVSQVGLGCWPIAGMTSLDVNDDDSRKTIRAAIDSGINFLDTAHCYGIDGQSETLIGDVIANCRNDVVIASKGGIHWDAQGVRHYNGHPEKIIQECEESLTRMKLDVIDLYYLHASDPDVPVADSAAAFSKLVEAGKIRSVGVSNLTVSEMQQFQSVCRIHAAQPPFNMLQRDIQADLLPWAEANGVSVFSYWPLMKGLLAGKIRRGHTFDPADNRLNYEIFQGAAFERAQQLLDSLDEIAVELGKTVIQVVVNWTFHQTGIQSVLCGAKRDWQIRESAGSIGWRLSKEHLEKIDQRLAALKQDQQVE